MSQFLYLYRMTEASRQQNMGTPEQAQQSMQRWVAWFSDLDKKGHLKLVKAGAKCGFGYLPMEKMERRVRKAMEEGGFGGEWLFPCDVGKDQDIEKFFAAAKEQFGMIDGGVFANNPALRKSGEFFRALAFAMERG